NATSTASQPQRHTCSLKLPLYNDQHRFNTSTVSTYPSGSYLDWKILRDSGRSAFPWTGIEHQAEQLHNACALGYQD
ncbi:MAG: hypothetical protein NTX56_12215, partial [Proteobacteria bacterium]|nr:hypothetical protein [Pseudomonadota bacterium]